jgi:putative FmdB family regulatory protein
MPTYQYQCKNCGYELEEFHSITAAPLLRCPSCDTDSLARVMGGGAGLIFKGSGFYLTDYKRSGASPGKQKPETSGEKKVEPKKAEGGGGSPDSTKPDKS